MAALPTNWQDGQKVHGSDLNAMDAAINANTAAEAADAAVIAVAQSQSQIALRVIANNGLGTGQNTGPTSTVGTGEAMFTIGSTATGIALMWDHWYSQTGGIDTDPTTTITFKASVRIVSSSNPNTVIGTLYRCTFNGQWTATLDPGGRMVSDDIGICVSPGDVIAVRTYLASGTAYVARGTHGFVNSAWGGFVAASDLTPPGSSAVTINEANAYLPAAVLGYPAAGSRSVLLVGDSITAGTGDGFAGNTAGLIPNTEWYGGGGFLPRALSGKAGILSVAYQGDRAAWFAGTNGSFRRLSNVKRCTSAVITYGINDIYNGAATAVGLQTNLLQIATMIRLMGIRKIFLTTLTPFTTSTDNWATLANQTTLTGETVRVAHNTWVRANCPIDPTTLLPVAVGTSNALLVGGLNHPFNGIFDTGSKAESSLNSGLWLSCRRVTTGSVTAGGAILTSSAANFQSAKQEAGGDLGSTFILAGAGAGGARFTGWISAVTSATQCSLAGGASTTVTNAQLNMGVSTIDGLHPSTRIHYAMSQAIDPALLAA